MKLSNAPGRKYQRRVKALMRLGSVGRGDTDARASERRTLVERTRNGEAFYRAIRTKKDRTARAKIAR